ncbi:uroporphyrinogen-III C-methyltransferase [Thermus scotoductus]|uniref:uroporphyrinogen-III C-methyltransferase n=1 Tax=Thermus scotoductus TaxID=37636 RepID=A0A430R753_THESC|nr:uroporphyrinogen-III C-methyltransferase [Thermus scotoductus]RTG91743.1 uroporphyrinogen-III C-methyltransferase [Thermus scotoductus]RTH03198.1 uroporphyrinogen-III C-methyltransferase [Thermus scotoductus]RTH22087.1 uroporphyrinogen-III C-methyltransferase [Thermus scotoductus]RTI00582.1 uroporphyrinogen-III C-methyltransferase [Thermus scotoductus]RTI23119.1 uroporphyrinogen-III C-methyltransferase [Thermus scotoductus]
MMRDRSRGKVYLVGAGPGDPELLTLRALRLLKRAEVVLYDRLVSPAVLEQVNPRAQLVYVGKELGEQDRVQEFILHQLLHHARSGKKVVRLKGGDPLVYGRGGEEWLFLTEKGIEVEVVPGVSSALAVPALAGIPLTMRGVSGGFAVLSGHTQGGRLPDLTPYTRVDTLVVLMGIKERSRIAQELVRVGRRPEEPVAFIERGSTPQERVVVSTLGEVAAGGSEVQPPAVWVIGEVVRIRARLKPFEASTALEPRPALSP